MAGLLVLRFVVIEAEEVGKAFLARQGRHRQGGHKLRTGLGQDAPAGDSTARQLADQLKRFVRRDPAANDQENAFAVHEPLFTQKVLRNRRHERVNRSKK